MVDGSGLVSAKSCWITHARTSRAQSLPSVGCVRRFTMALLMACTDPKRRMHCWGSITDSMAQTLINQLHQMETQDAEKPIELLINSPGGDLHAACAIVDVIASVSPPVHTTALGQCLSAATLILAAGEPGHRVVHPSTRLMIHQAKKVSYAHSCGSVDMSQFDVMALEVEISKNELKATNELMIDMLARFTHRTKEKLTTDLARDKFMSAAEAVGYGLADLVHAPKTRKPAAVGV